jgi:hypothetical protein
VPFRFVYAAGILGRECVAFRVGFAAGILGHA